MTIEAGRPAADSDRRRLAAAVLLVTWLACVWYGFVGYQQLNPEPMGLGPFFAGVGAFLMWQLVVLLPAAAAWFVVRPWPWRSLWSIARLPLIVSGGGWLLLLTVVVALRLRAIG